MHAIITLWILGLWHHLHQMRHATCTTDLEDSFENFHAASILSLPHMSTVYYSKKNRQYHSNEPHYHVHIACLSGSLISYEIIDRKETTVRHASLSDPHDDDDHPSSH